MDTTSILGLMEQKGRLIFPRGCPPTKQLKRITGEYYISDQKVCQIIAEVQKQNKMGHCDPFIMYKRWGQHSHWIHLWDLKPHEMWLVPFTIMQQMDFVTPYLRTIDYMMYTSHRSVIGKEETDNLLTSHINLRNNFLNQAKGEIL